MPAIPFPSSTLLGDGNVVLRAWRRSDVAALVDMCRDPEILRWTLVPSGYSDDDAYSRFERVERERVAGRGIYLAVVDAHGDRLLGACDLLISPTDPKIGELAYMLSAAARGHGVMTRAVRLIALWGLRAQGLARIEILTHPENERSIAVAQRAGFRREGLLRSYRDRTAGREDRLIFSLLADDL